MPAYQFPEMPVRGCGNVAEATYRLLVASMSLATYSITWTGATVCTVNPFTGIPEVEERQEVEAGSFGVDGGTFNFINDIFTGAVRMSTLLQDYSPIDTRWFIRIQKKNGVSWDTLRDLMFDPTSYNIRMPVVSDADSWRLNAVAVDPLMLLDEINIAQIVSELPHATYDYTPTAVYVCYKSGATSYRREMTYVKQDDRAGGLEWVSAGALRFFKLTDILEAFASVLNLSTTINDGAAIDHDWDYIIYDGSVDQSKGFDDLYIVSALYNASVYQHFFTFFDANRWADYSFYNFGAALELLKGLLLPHGLIAEMRTNTSGQMYIHIRQMLQNSGTSFASWRKDAEISPADRLLSGLVVNTSEASDHIIQSSGDGATALKNIYLTGNRIPDGSSWKSEPGRCDDLFSCYGGLWALHGTEMHSVYKINVKSHGQTGSSGTGITADYDDETASNVMGRAMGAYFYNQASPATDPIGIYRRIMQRLTFQVGGLQTDPDPGEYVDYNSQQWWVLSRRWNFEENKTQFICECGDL